MTYEIEAWFISGVGDVDHGEVKENRYFVCCRYRSGKIDDVGR